MDLRTLGRDDRDLLRALRLRALADAPWAFSSTLAREAAFTDADWDARLARPGASTFVAVGRGGAPVGLVTGVPDPEQPRAADLVGMWVDPAARRSGVGDSLVARLMVWAREGGVDVMRLCVTEGNKAAERLYARNGFVRTGCSEVIGSSGLVEIGMECVIGSSPPRSAPRP